MSPREPACPGLVKEEEEERTGRGGREGGRRGERKPSTGNSDDREQGNNASAREDQLIGNTQIPICSSTSLSC